MPAKRAESVDWETIRRQWDNLAQTRFDQITSGRDITYNHVLIPEVLSAIQGSKYASGIDVGCGVGVMTHRISGHFERLTGIDISRKSIEIAEDRFSSPTTKFICQSVEAYSIAAEAEHDFVLANMFLMDTPDLEGAVVAIKNLMKPSGTFVAVIPHPAFWPEHYGYAKESWFSYMSEIAVEMNFHISTENNPLLSIHFHRPIERYAECLLNYGFCISSLREIFPTESVINMYPKRWDGPRYLMISCTRS